MAVSEKKRSIAMVLCLAFGLVGAHRFYTKRYVTAIIQLFTLGGGGVWAVIDFIFIACGAFEDKDKKVLRTW